MKTSILSFALLLGLGLMAFGQTVSPDALAQTPPVPAKAVALASGQLDSAGKGYIIVNNIWVALCFILILLMQPGFAFLEAGAIRSTNAINVLFKNVSDFCIGGIMFFIIGYSIMWNTSQSGMVGVPDFGWLKADAWMPQGIEPKLHFLFQLVFAMTAVTICSGGVAGRIKLGAYLIITLALVMIIYPVSGYWAWNDGGWLHKMGFHDFAGSSVVHVVGGCAALAGALTLGPRESKKKGTGSDTIDPTGQIQVDYKFGFSANRPHSIPLMTLGTLLLWIGWFGFNGGSGLAIEGTDEEWKILNLEKVGRILLNTMLASCAGGLTATLSSTISNSQVHAHQKIPGIPLLQIDLDLMLNGLLGGLVAITAGCDVITDPLDAIVLGGTAGMVLVMVISITSSRNAGMFSFDDPVNAFAVHGVCGFIGTIGCAIFSDSDKISVGTQVIGFLAIAGWSIVCCGAVFLILKHFSWLRVEQKQEIEGLDSLYHGMSAYEMDYNARD